MVRLGVVNLTIPQSGTPTLGGVPVEIDDEDIALSGAGFATYDPKISDAL
jgi:hypothetical protein